MTQTALESPKDRPEVMQALADQIVNHQSGIHNYFLASAVDFRFTRRLGLEPSSLPGRLVAGTFHFLTFIVPALFLKAITQDGSGPSLVSWIIVSLGWSGVVSIGSPLYRLTIPNHLSWLGAIVEEGDLRQLLAWCNRWYSLRAVALGAGVLTLGTVLPFYLLVVRGSAVPVPAGTLYIGSYALFLLLQAAYGWVMMSFEAYHLTTFSYELYRLSPADSVVVRRSLHGYSQLAAANVLVSTGAILFFLLLLPADSGLVWPVVLFLLLVQYLSAGVGVVLPRLMLGRIIRRTKAAEMELLQIRVNNLLPRIGELTDEEREEFTQLQETHDAIRDSPENLLPLGAILRNVGALLLSTATILVAAFAEEWIAWLAKSLQP
jgi:hypothetical protein